MAKDKHVTSDQAANFLLSRTDSRRIKSDDDRSLAEKLASDLGHLPLALEQAAAFVAARNISFADYLEQWNDEKQGVLEWYDETQIQYPVSAAITWQFTIKRLSLPAQALLRICSFLAPEPIPTAMFNEVAERLDGTVNLLAKELRRKAGQFDPSSALSELDTYSMITRRTDSFTIHRIVQHVTQFRIPDKSQRAWLQAALKIVNDYAPTDSDDVRTWPIWDPLRPHVERIAQSADHAEITYPTVRLMSALGNYFHYKGLYQQAETWKRRNLEIREESLGMDHIHVAAALNDLANLLLDTNRLSEAEPMYHRALKIDEESLGPDHPYVATTLNNLAQLLKATNRLSEAEPMYHRALKIDEESLGPDHPDVAIRLNNLAGLLQATNRLTEAEPLRRRALKIDEKSFGPDHPQVATDLNNLAQLLQDTNRLTEAESLMRRALEIDEKSFGPDHPEVATHLNNLAQLLQATYRLTEAESLMRRALEIDTEYFGPDHRDVAIDLNNLAQLLKATNRLTEAEPLLRRALEIDEESSGPNPPDAAIALHNLAQLLRATNRPTEAEPLLRRAVKVFIESLGHDHPRTITARTNLEALEEALRTRKDPNTTPNTTDNQ